jgi:DNA-binding response OmpR family regulator
MVKIIHVDNELDSVNLVKTILEKEGFDVFTARNGKECLDKMKEEDADLLLLEVMMSDMSGWDLYQKIREMNKKPKVAFLSVIDVSKERREILLNSGISDYITKPVDNDDLIKRVKKIVGSK